MSTKGEVYVSNHRGGDIWSVRWVAFDGSRNGAIFPEIGSRRKAIDAAISFIRSRPGEWDGMERLMEQDKQETIR